MRSHAVAAKRKRIRHDAGGTIPYSEGASRLLMNLMIPDFLPGLALAVIVGLLIGLERGWQARAEPDGHRVAGVRTFAMLGLFGGLVGIAASGPLYLLALVASAGVVAALLIGHALDMRMDGTVSATAAIAAVLTLLLGALAGAGQHALASIAGGALVALLAARAPLHALLRESSEDDMKAFARLALVVFLVLPLLPDAGFGPFGSLNPRRIWFVVVIVGAISFSGYVLSRWLGRERGGLIAAAVGALVSSTAVTVASAHEIRRGGGLANQAGIALASSIMIARTVILTAILAPLALPQVAWLIGPALLLSLVAAGALVLLGGRTGSDGAEMPAKPPGLGVAFLFAALVALLTLTATWLEHRMGEQSAATLVALGGMIDVDSAIAAIGALPPSALSPQLAAYAIAAPVAFNSLLKLALMLGIAGLRRSLWAAITLILPPVAIGGAVLVALL